jgi:4-hydroxybenzoate polyprenyltransferase
LLPHLGLLVFSGAGFAHWDRALTLRGEGALGWVLLAWALLHAGTLWLNAAVDRDEGEVLLGRPVPVPDGIEREAGLALAGCVLLASQAGALAGLAALGASVLAVLYSHPRTFWKAHPTGGPVVNLLGYGLLSPLAGWSTVGVSFNLRTGLAAGLLALIVLGMYFAAQAFQEAEDRQRGYRTWVATYGVASTVAMARACIGLGWAGGMALAAAGWLPPICLLGGPMGWWTDRWMATRSPAQLGEAWARGVTRRLALSALVGFLLAFGVYLNDSLADRPVAGLATPGGHPADRPRIGPRAMAVWEQQQGLR